jgi:hypothetical protein
MSRDDSMYATTMSSSNPLKSKAALRRQAEKEDKHKPDPKADAVLQLIAIEKATVTRTDHILFDKDMTNEQKAAKIERIQDQYAFLTRLEAKMQRILGIKPEAKHE